MVPKPLFHAAGGPARGQKQLSPLPLAASYDSASRSFDVLVPVPAGGRSGRALVS